MMNIIQSFASRHTEMIDAASFRRTQLPCDSNISKPIGLVVSVQKYIGDTGLTR